MTRWITTLFSRWLPNFRNYQLQKRLWMDRIISKSRHFWALFHNTRNRIQRTRQKNSRKSRLSCSTEQRFRWSQTESWLQYAVDLEELIVPHVPKARPTIWIFSPFFMIYHQWIEPTNFCEKLTTNWRKKNLEKLLRKLVN